MEQLLAHLVGDYCLQSDWMANKKTSSSWPAFVHAIVYTLPFLLLTQEHLALWFICATHFAIDRWRLAKYVCYVKNFLAPRKTVTDVPPPPDMDGAQEIERWWYSWKECTATGYHRDRPAWLAVWLLIITDNTMHLLCNYAALRWWA